MTAVAFLRRLFLTPEGALPPSDARTAIAAVLVMAARSDGTYEQGERAIIEDVLARRFGLGPAEAAALRGEGEAVEAEAVDLFQFTRAIKLAVPIEDRVALVEALWRVVLADGSRDPHEDALMRQLVDRLGLTARDSAEARQRVVGQV